MKKSKFSDSQIMHSLKRVEAGLGVPDLCREIGISTATFYKWRAKHLGPDVVDAFLALEQQFHSIAVSYCDWGADLQKQLEYLQLAQMGGPSVTVPAGFGKS